MAQPGTSSSVDSVAIYTSSITLRHKQLVGATSKDGIQQGAQALKASSGWGRWHHGGQACGNGLEPSRAGAAHPAVLSNVPLHVANDHLLTCKGSAHQLAVVGQQPPLCVWRAAATLDGLVAACHEELEDRADPQRGTCCLLQLRQPRQHVVTQQSAQGVLAFTTYTSALVARLLVSDSWRVLHLLLPLLLPGAEGSSACTAAGG
mmetsp:Transcript_29341/g.64951  ORF Transcript_29341/g.64951 Transcript_29341/m.64951 type:complete len:205 (-) Transcript_29341:203-817(-)